MRADGEKENSSHDFGRDILPGLIGRADMYAYDFQTNRIPGDPAGAPVYWRDVGTLDAFFDANMDLRSVSPELNLYNRAVAAAHRRIFRRPGEIHLRQRWPSRRGSGFHCLGREPSFPAGMVRTSVIGRGVRVHSHASIEDSIIFDNCDIGRRARVRRAILDKNVRVPPDTSIGYDLERDRQLYHVTDSGIVVVEGYPVAGGYRQHESLESPRSGS